MYFPHSGVTLHRSEIIPSLKEKSYDLLTRFSERATAEVLLGTLGRTLAVLGLSLQDVSGITTDAATVMVKLGGLLQAAVQRPAPGAIDEEEPGPSSSAPITVAKAKPFFHMLCMAHGLHLAVLDAFKLTRAEDSGENPESQAEEVATWDFVLLEEGRFSAQPFASTGANPMPLS